MFKYNDLLKEIEYFAKYGVETGSIGKTVLGADIPYIFIEGGANKARPPAVGSIIVTGAIHAREHITALLVLCQAKHVLRNGLPLSGGIYFIPMVNPDGVRLCQESADFLDGVKLGREDSDYSDGVKPKRDDSDYSDGVKPKDEPLSASISGADGDRLKKELISINKSMYFGLWKANANCVDLNVNFDADWGKGKSNVFYKASSDYVGKSPLDQPESRALADFTLRVKPLATLSYHCKGEEIYWYYRQRDKLLWKSYRLAKMLARETNYRLTENKGSAGGYKDWCIQKLGVPAFTVEVGSDNFKHPYPYSDFENILRVNCDTPRRLLNALAKSEKQNKTALSL